MGSIAGLVIKIRGDVGGLRSALSEAASSVADAGEKIQGIGAKMTAGVTLPLLGMGAAALKMSTDFNAGMANVASLGLPIERVNELKRAVQEMSIELGKSTADLTDGLYQVISAFGDTADTVEILRINAQAAAAGLATTTDAINLTSAITKAYGDVSAQTVQQVSDLAFQAVKLGQTTFPELASSMGRVAPLAASLGVSVEELFGVMATFTGVTGSASEVSTQLRGVLQSMMAPTASMKNLIAEMGFASGAAMVQQLGLQGSIAAIVQAANEAGAPLQSYIGSIEGQTLALAATGGQAVVFSEKMAAMSDALGASDAAFAAQTQSVNALGFQWSQLIMRVGVFTQRVGDILTPIMLTLIAALDPLIVKAEELLSVFENLDPTTQAIGVGVAALTAAAGPALMALGAAMTMVAPAIGAVGTALGLLLSPIGLVVAAVAGLGVAWTLNLGGIQEITASVVDDVGNAFNTATESLAGFGEYANLTFRQLFDGAQSVFAQIGDVLAPAMDRIQTAFGGVGESVNQLAPHFEGLLAAALGMGDALKAVLPIVSGLAQALGVTLVVAASAAMNLVAAAIQNMASIVGPIIDQVSATITLLVTTVKNVAALVMAVATGDWPAAWQAMQNIVGGFKDYFLTTLENVKSFGVAIFDTLKQTVLNTLADLDSGAKSQMDALRAWWDGAWSALTGAFEPVRQGIETVQSTIDGLKKAIEDFVGWIKGVSIPNPFAGIQMPSLPSLPSLPNPFGGNRLGTVYAHGGWSWVGEAGPELVRLPRGARVFSAQESQAVVGGGVNVTIQQANIRSEQDIWQLAHAIEAILRRQ